MSYIDLIIQRITPQIIGAGRSIDVLIDNESFLKEGNIEDFLLVADQRLNIRVVLSGFSKVAIRTYQNKFQSLNVKPINIKTKIDLIIIDGSQVFCINKSITELKSYPVPIYYTDDPFLVKEQNEFFEYLWSQISDSIIYSEIENIHKPSFVESIYFGSNSLKSSLLRELRKDPGFIYKIEPVEFEKLVELLLKNLGFRTFVTPRTRDGGKDILAKFDTPDGHEGLCLVECKRYAPERKVNVQTVRSLFGVVQDERANLGMIVTTSSYTKDAYKFQKRNIHTISLKDFEDLKKWINSTST